MIKHIFIQNKNEIKKTTIRKICLKEYKPNIAEMIDIKQPISLFKGGSTWTVGSN